MKILLIALALIIAATAHIDFKIIQEYKAEHAREFQNINMTRQLAEIE